ncbi:MAG: DUF2080 family transposase-associated protein [Desulfobacteraceae bacterium]|nr:DUF2080 family transposase-associated protein [Desulfobacteraceae bacterium]
MENFKKLQAEHENKTDLFGKAKFDVLGEEMIEKKVTSSGNSGRIYLPPEWIGTKVKVIKL